jgi:hypothetical protein
MSKIIKIDRQKWAEAGIRKGYLTVGSHGGLDLRKEAMDPITLTLLTGAAMYAAGEGLGALWNYQTGGRSLQEVMGGFKATSESVAQYETGLLELKKIRPLLNGTTLSVQEAADDAIKQGFTTLELLNAELTSKGIAPPNIAQKQAAEAKKRKEIEANNLIILFNAAKKPVGGTRPGNPETKKSDITPEAIVKKTGEEAKDSLEQAKTQVATQGASKSSAPAGGKQLNPRALGG